MRNREQIVIRGEGLLGGLVASTLLTLFALPAIYGFVARPRAPSR